jgi:hypothetical protein
LTELLVASLDEEHEIARPWANEAERRYEELRSGAARPIPAKEVFNKRRPADRWGSPTGPVQNGIPYGDSCQWDENPNGIPPEFVIALDHCRTPRKHSTAGGRGRSKRWGDPEAENSGPRIN